jgi:hypothetical protein
MPFFSDFKMDGGEFNQVSSVCNSSKLSNSEHRVQWLYNVIFLKQHANINNCIDILVCRKLMQSDQILPSEKEKKNRIAEAKQTHQIICNSKSTMAMTLL